MGEFKKSFRDYKHRIQTTQKSKPNQNRRLITSSIVVISFIAIFVAILYFTAPQNAPPKVTTIKEQIKVNKEAKTKSRQEIHTEGKKDILIQENSVEDITFLRTFKRIYTVLLDKLIPVAEEDRESFEDNLMKYAKRLSYDVFLSYSGIYKMSNELQEDLYNYEKNQTKGEEDSIADSVIYSNILFKYTEIIFATYDEFNSGILPDLVDLEIDKGMKTDDFKLVYQQLHIRHILLSVIHIVDGFKEEIVNFIGYLMDFSSSTTLFASLYFLMEENKVDLLKEFGKDIGFIFKGAKVKVPNLLSKFKEYYKFLVVNVYVIFMHLFRINGDFEVVQINEKFTSSFFKRNGNGGDSKIKNGIIEKCKNIFLLVMNVGNIDNFYDVNKKKFEECKGVIWKGMFANMKD
eukprot:GAHX01002766.1.p1 GENE.GAHX01002766.1~~GAHX01002766.1.p1  ORF type:complete len:404 (-),score=73.40 GAHX01002766.1:69-1280(-)